MNRRLWCGSGRRDGLVIEWSQQIVKEVKNLRASRQARFVVKLEKCPNYWDVQRIVIVVKRSTPTEKPVVWPHATQVELSTTSLPSIYPVSQSDRQSGGRAFW